MDLFETIRSRSSIREFDPAVDVSPEQLDQILHAAINAPSAGNCQPWHFVVVRDLEVRRGLSAAAFGQGSLTQAPVVIAVCTDAQQTAPRYGKRGLLLYCLQDTAAATENILLTVTAMGLGACWVGAFDEESAARALGLPREFRPVALIPIGHPTGVTSRLTSRRPLKDVVSYR